MKLCAFNCTVSVHFSQKRLLIKDRVSLDGRPAEVQIFSKLYKTAHTQFRPKVMPPTQAHTASLIHVLHILYKSKFKPVIQHDVLFIVRGHDASISRGSLKAVDRSVQESHTSAASPPMKPYCGFTMKLCPRSSANLKQKLNDYLQNSPSPKKTKCQLYVCISVTSYLGTGTAEVKLYTRQCFDR